MDKTEQIRINKFENREGSLEVVDGLPTFSRSADLFRAEELFLRKIGVKPTDSPDTKTKKIFSRDTEILYQNKDGKDVFYIAHKGRTIIAFEGVAGRNSAQELIQDFFDNMAERELGELHETVVLKNNKDEAVKLEVQQFKKELTNLEKKEVRSHLKDTRILFRELKKSQKKHLKFFRTLGVKETEKEKLAYEKLKHITNNAIQTLNRMNVKLDSAGNQPRVLNSVEKDVERMRTVLYDKLDKASNDRDSFYRFNTQIPNDVLTSQVLFTPEDYAKWFGLSYRQDELDAYVYGEELAYNIVTKGMKSKNGYNELASQLETMDIDPALLQFLELKTVKNADGTTTTVAVTSNIDKKNCKKCNRKKHTGIFEKDFINNGLGSALTTQLMNSEWAADLSPKQRNFVRLVGFIGGAFAMFKLAQAGWKGIKKMTGSESLLTNLAALAAIEAGLTVFAGQGAIQSLLGVTFGGKGAQKIMGWADHWGLTDALDIDSKSDVPLAATTALLGGKKVSELHKYVTTNSSGQKTWNYNALMKDFPDNIADINNLRNHEKTNPNYVEDYFNAVGVNPTSPDGSQAGKTLAEAAIENKSEHAATILAMLKDKNLEAKNPETWTLMVSQYDPSLSEWENLQKFKEKGWVKEIPVQYGIEKQKLDDVKAMFKGVQFKEIKKHLGDMSSRDSINIGALEDIAEKKNSGTLNKLINKYGSPEMKTLVFEVFETIGIDQGSPSPLNGTSYDNLFVEAVIGLHEKESERRNQIKTFLASEALIIKDGYNDEVEAAFTLNGDLTTDRERKDALEALIKEHPEYFEFDYREIPFLLDVTSIDKKFTDQLADVEGISSKEKVILAGVATKLSNDYPSYPITYSSAGNGKIKMKFKGSEAGKRLDLDKKELPANEFDMILNVKNLSVDGFANKDLKSVSFKNQMPDKGLVGLPLHVFQMGLMREVYEGKSTTNTPFGKERRGWAEMFGYSEDPSFSTASFMQQRKQRALNLGWSDVIPGLDVLNVFLEYGTSSVRAESTNGKVSNLPTSKEYKNALIDNLNAWKYPNGNSIWQIERERKDDEKANKTLKRIYDEGIIEMGIAEGSRLGKDLYAFMKDQTPDWLKDDRDKFKSLVKTAHDNGIELTKTVLYGVGSLMKDGVEIAVEAGKLVMKVGKAVIDLTSTFGHAFMEDVRSGKINIADWTDDVLTIALLAGGGYAIFRVIGPILAAGGPTLVNGANGVRGFWANRGTLAKLGITAAGATGLYIYFKDPIDKFIAPYLPDMVTRQSQAETIDELETNLMYWFGNDYDALNKNKDLDKMMAEMKKVEAAGHKVKTKFISSTKELEITVEENDGSGNFTAKKPKKTVVDFEKQVDFVKMTGNKIDRGKTKALPKKPAISQTLTPKKHFDNFVADVKSGTKYNDIKNIQNVVDASSSNKVNVLDILRADLEQGLKDGTITQLVYDAGANAIIVKSSLSANQTVIQLKKGEKSKIILKNSSGQATTRTYNFT